MKTVILSSYALVLSLLCSLQIAAAAPLTNSRDVKKLFQKPTRDYSNGPLWVWNDMLTEDQIRSTLRDLASQNVKQVWVHPRPGLMTPYLSEDWFRLWKLSLKEAARLDMNVWIYDENSYPSGFAGGLVPEFMPESRGRGLRFEESKTAPAWSTNLVSIYSVAGDSCQNITARIRAGETLPEGRYVGVREVWAGNSPWHGNRCYVNLLSPGVTEKFLEVTLEPYRKEIGKQFGKRVPGVFTDEPNIRPAGDFPWSEVLAAEFQKRWGYNLLDHLPSLLWQVGDWRKVRHNYFQVLHEQFVEHWAKPYFRYCETNNLEFTGHYWDHEWPNCVGVPDNMAMYAWHQRPAIDCLMNQYAEHTHAQFGNVRMVKELSSVANQLGWTRTLCEIYGAGGWDLRFEDMKRIGDWLQVLGVNTLNEHLSYVTLRGARKRDHPQSFSYHTPWWEGYHVMADYFARVSAALSQGEQINPILVLQPTTTAWMYQREGKPLGDLGSSFFTLLMDLEAAQIEYDLGSEDILAQHGKVEGNRLRVGNRVYEHVVIPSGTENLNSSTVRLLARLSALYLTRPTRVDGHPASLPMETPEVTREQVLHSLQKAQQSTSTFFKRDSGDSGKLFHHRRILKDGELLFLVNTSLETSSSGTILSSLQGVEQWDLFSGRIATYPHSRIENGITLRYSLPPAGSVLLFLSKQPARGEPTHLNTQDLLPMGTTVVTRLAPNVLTLDFVDVQAGSESKTNVYFYEAGQFIWKQHGLPRNPWDSAVQFKDELIRQTFPPESGFTARYSFEIDGTPPEMLEAVVERPDLYSITCNGQTISPSGKWWLDKSFGRLDLSSIARPGRNILVLSAKPFSMFHELEPVYIIGDFSLTPVDRGFIISAARPLALEESRQVLTHSGNPEGTMWLTSGIGFQSAGGAVDDRAPYIVFDLRKASNLSGIEIWNYCETYVQDLTGRGVKRLRISASSDLEPLLSGGTSTHELGEFELRQATSPSEGYQVISLTKPGVRYVRFDVLANHHGVTFPAQGEPVDRGFVGIAKVHFQSEGQRLSGVSVAKTSSELLSHRRAAANVLRTNGITGSRPGWNMQGMPFYGDRVSYCETFKLSELKGTYAVSLGAWLGSVAQIRVNNKEAGWIVSAPWECDVTRFLRKGENQVEVIVIGTLKNTLGPHHGNPALGAAWPNAFHKGAANGPPPGARYSTVGYGLFERFVLLQRREGPVQMSELSP